MSIVETVRRFDPITFQVLWSRLVSIADEIATTLVKTAFSPAVGDGQDYACALYDSRGRMLAQSTHCTPGIIGSMPFVMREFLRVYPAATLAPGDVLICNDPWFGAGHTPDIYIATPIFRGADLVAYAVNAAHHIDVGGRVYCPESREVFEEGVMVPVSKLYRAGEPNDELLRLLQRNARLPDKLMGDLRAQMAANWVGAQRVLGLLEDRDLDGLDDLADQIIEHTEASMRAAIAEVPDGVFTHEVQLERPEPSGEFLKIAVQVTKAGDGITIDFTGSSRQVDRPINCVYNFTYAYTVFAIKSALHPHIPNNEGTMRPIRIIAPEGCILNAQFPAPVMLRTSFVYYAVEAVYGALAPVIPARVIAASGTYPLWIMLFSGKHANGRPFIFIFWGNGGQGAGADRDGYSALVFPPNTSNTSAEIFETDTVLAVERKEFAPDTGGPGRFRGGVGQEIVVRNVADHAVTVSAIGGRHVRGAPGLLGGKPGAVGIIQVEGQAPLEGHKQLQLAPGQAIYLRYPGGGGFGDPFEREPDRVLEDVRRGIVTLEHAAEDYGIVVRSDLSGIDDVATARRRACGARHENDTVRSDTAAARR
jgi:N-methylhydantoinase B/oxoprolinase/acetone carboxylase alpha subunit